MHPFQNDLLYSMTSNAQQTTIKTETELTHSKLMRTCLLFL